MTRSISDPMERLIADALENAVVAYLHESDGGIPLDFLLLRSGVHIEVKRMHSPRIADQMARAENVIAAQGKDAVQWLAQLITDNAHLKRELRETTNALMAERNAV